MEPSETPSSRKRKFSSETLPRMGDDGRTIGVALDLLEINIAPLVSAIKYLLDYEDTLILILYNSLPNCVTNLFPFMELAIPSRRSGIRVELGVIAALKRASDDRKVNVWIKFYNEYDREEICSDLKLTTLVMGLERLGPFIRGPDLMRFEAGQSVFQFQQDWTRDVRFKAKFLKCLTKEYSEHHPGFILSDKLSSVMSCCKEYFPDVTILSLRIDGKCLKPDGILNTTTNYFRERFSSPEDPLPKFDWDVLHMPSKWKKKFDRTFSEEEIRKAVYRMNGGEVPGPDGYNVMFFQNYWKTLKKDIMEIMNAFYNHNYGLHLSKASWLILKKSRDQRDTNDDVSTFKVNMVHNCIYRIITSVLAKRLKPVADSNTNSDYLAPSEKCARACVRACARALSILNENNKGRGSILLTLDLTNAFDDLDWDFLRGVLKAKGFRQRWIQWIDYCLSSSSLKVLLNGELGETFEMKKGLKQGCPLTPLLFILVRQTFDAIISRTEGKVFWSRAPSRSVLQSDLNFDANGNNTSGANECDNIDDAISKEFNSEDAGDSNDADDSENTDDDVNEEYDCEESDDDEGEVIDEDDDRHLIAHIVCPVKLNIATDLKSDLNEFKRSSGVKIDLNSSSLIYLGTNFNQGCELANSLECKDFLGQLTEISPPGDCVPRLKSLLGLHPFFSRKIF